MPKILEYDGVVIGAGHNGMICAGYLAKCGQKIMVVEKNMEVGGGLDSHEDRNYPGFWHNIHSVFHRGLMMLPWYKDLELENFGIHYYKPDPGVVHHFLDETYLGWFADVKKTAETIGTVGTTGTRGSVQDRVVQVSNRVKQGQSIWGES